MPTCENSFSIGNLIHGVGAYAIEGETPHYVDLAMKKPIVIALLNYWVWGLGSIILGHRRLSNSLIALGCLPLTYLSLSFSPIGPFRYADASTWPLQFVGMMAVSMGFAISGYVEARGAEER